MYFNCAKSCSSTFFLNIYEKQQLRSRRRRACPDPSVVERWSAKSRLDKSGAPSAIRKTPIQFSNVTTSCNRVHHRLWENIQVAAARVFMAPRRRETKDSNVIFSGGGDIHKSHVKCHRCRKVMLYSCNR